MNRFWASVALLAAVLAVSCGNLFAISGTVDELSAALLQAQRAAEQAQLPAARQLIAQAQDTYEQREGYLSAVVSEKLLDAVRLGFARAQAGAQTGDCAQLPLELAELRQAVEELLRVEAVGLKNIF